jgi:hypothetical protein
MAMPEQLRRGLAARYAKPKRFRVSRPIAEQLPRIDINDLARYRVFPDQWHVSHSLELPFRYPFVRKLTVSLAAIEAHHHSGYVQSIPVRWVATGFGGTNRPRAVLGCRCGRSVLKVYYEGGRLACRRCVNAVHASQALGKHTRPALQTTRLRAFIKALPPQVRNTTKARLNARCQAIAKSAQGMALKSNRLAPVALQVQSNYQARATPYWR